MKRLYLEHREVEEARDLDAVVATFDDDCFLENVALGTRASGREAVRKSYEALFRSFPMCAFVNVVPFRNGRMQGEKLFFDIPALCAGAGISVEDVLARAASARQA